MASMGLVTQAKVTVAAVVAAVTATVAGVVVSQWIAIEDHQSVVVAGLNSAVILAFAVVGAVIAAARPDNRVGWLMLAGGVTWSLGSASVDLAHHGIVTDPGSLRGASALAVLGAGVRAVGWYLETLAVPMYFPDGRLAGPRFRWLSPMLVVILVASVVDPLTDPQADLTDLGGWRNPMAPDGPWSLISTAAFVGHIPLSLVATVGVVLGLLTRWRDGDARQRRQLRLFATAAALPVIAAPISFLGAGGWAFAVAALPLPFAIGFAILSGGLYDLRSATNRTLVWLTLSASVAAAYALVIVGVGGLLHVDRSVTWLPWTAAAVVAVSFAPLRGSLQRGVNRITYGRWDEPYDVLAALGQRVEATADADRLLADVATELTGLGLRDVSIRDASDAVVAGDDSPHLDPHPDVVRIPLLAYGTVVGAVHYRPPATPLRDRDRQLLEDLAGHLGGVLHSQRLTRDLQLARERLVLAREEERRRLRRDLHDGLGPALAGHLLRLDVIAARVGRDRAASADIDSLRDDLRTTVGEVRRVVEGLRPPALDELGLLGALDQVTQRLTAGTPTSVSIEADRLPPLSAAVEVAVFRIVTEAMTNVVRHAQATTCRICLAAEGDRIRVTVADDGRGVDGAGSPRSGHGLQTMRERAEELRGHLRVGRSRGGVGTTVSADLPLPAGRRHPRQAAANVAAR
jgi:signal transduction histidine kinase